MLCDDLEGGGTGCGLGARLKGGDICTPRTEEPGRVQSMESQRVGHDLAPGHTPKCHSRSLGKSLSVFLHLINVNILEIGAPDIPGTCPWRGYGLLREGN